MLVFQCYHFSKQFLSNLSKIKYLAFFITFCFVVSLIKMVTLTTGAPVGMWTWGRVHTKFWQPPSLYQPGGADYVHPQGRNCRGDRGGNCPPTFWQNRRCRRQRRRAAIAAILLLAPPLLESHLCPCHNISQVMHPSILTWGHHASNPAYREI